MEVNELIHEDVLFHLMLCVWGRALILPVAFILPIPHTTFVLSIQWRGVCSNVGMHKLEILEQFHCILPLVLNDMAVVSYCQEHTQADSVSKQTVFLSSGIFLTHTGLQRKTDFTGYWDAAVSQQIKFGLCYG